MANFQSLKMDHLADYDSSEVAALRADLALALRAASMHGLSEGVCNHFSVELPDGSGRFLLNPQGFLWSELQAEDIVLIDRQGSILAGKHPVESTAMYIHAAVHRICRKACVLHTHQPYSTALALTAAGQLDTTLSQNAMRFHGRVAVDGQYNGLALDAKEGERIARSMQLPAVAVAATAATAIDGSGVVPDSSAATTTTSSSDAQYADVGFLCNHGVIVCGERIDHAYDDLYYLERASMHQVLAQQTGLPLRPSSPEIAARVMQQTISDRGQSELFFAALRRTCTGKT